MCVCVSVLHMCFGYPGPPGGAHSTDNCRSHGPAVGSLPATEHTVQEVVRVVCTFTSHLQYAVIL